MKQLGVSIPYQPRYTLGQNWGNIFTSLVSTAGQAYAADQAADAAEDAAEAAAAGALAEVEAARLRLQQQREAQSEDLIPGVPNTVLAIGGLGIAGLAIYALT